MERGVIAGGVLVTASFLLAVLLNHSAVKEGAPMPGTDMDTSEQGQVIDAAAPTAPVLGDPVGNTRSDAGSDQGCCKPDDASCLARKTPEAQGKPPCASP